LVELEQRCRLDERAKLRDPVRAHEQRDESEYEAIESGQIRRAPPGSITDQELMFEQKRFCGDGPYATWAQQRRERDQQMNSEHEPFAHGANGTIVVSACKTARCGQIASHYEFATHTFPYEMR